MKKKLLTILLLFALSVSAVACGGKESESNEPPKTTDNQDGITSENNDSKKADTTKSDSTEATEKTIKDIEDYLLAKGVLSGERVEKAATIIGGISGFMYRDSVGEVYEYDTESEAYKKLLNGEGVSIEGMEGYTMTPVSMNGKFVLFGEDVPQDLIDAFNSFK